MSARNFDILNSPFFVDEPDNWHLKPDAPPELVKEFEEFMRGFDEPEDQGFEEFS